MKNQQAQQQKIRIFWIDKFVYEGQNEENLRRFRQKFKKYEFEQMNSIQVLKYELTQTKNKKVIVISSAGLEQKVYEYMNKHPKINKIVLFCLSEDKAKVNINTFNKMHKVQGLTPERLQLIIDQVIQKQI